jgi:hypothetical protein
VTHFYRDLLENLSPKSLELEDKMDLRLNSMKRVWRLINVRPMNGLEKQIGMIDQPLHDTLIQ